MCLLIDFGYTWPWTHGHLVVATLALLLCWLAWSRRWYLWGRILFGAIFLWSIAAFLVVQFVFRFNEVPALPTQSFLASGSGRVLDLGAGSGRTSIMVLQKKPAATLVALDNFSATYIRDHGEQKTMENFREAGVEERASVKSADMRELPFEDGSFDAVISAYAIDHLDREAIPRALREAARVLRPRGEFLLEVMYPDAWMRFAWGPMLFHGARSEDLKKLWKSRLEEAGFEIIELGTEPITLYLLAIKR